MPFTSEQLAYAGRAAIDYYLKNDPVDNVNVTRPLIRKLIDGKQEYAGAQQYVVEQLRYQNDSNFQSYYGDQQVSFNRKRTLQQAKYTWGAFHDGFGLNEDELVANGITMTDDRNAVPSDAEKMQLTNIIKENMETLKLGFEENFDIMLHRDGSHSATDIAGLDALISTAGSGDTSVIGGLSAATATNPWWQNYANTGISTATAGNLVTQMEIAWRATIRVGGKAPDFILVGSAFLDAYRTDAELTVNRQIFVGGSMGNKKPVTIDAGIGDGVNTGLYFKGVELIWDPVFDTMQTLDAPAIHWEKRCYFLRTDRLKLRPIKGHWMIPRRPPRVHDRYVHYWALTSKAALTTGKRNAHAVLSIQ